MATTLTRLNLSALEKKTRAEAPSAATGTGLSAVKKAFPMLPMTSTAPGVGSPAPVPVAPDGSRSMNPARIGMAVRSWATGGVTPAPASASASAPPSISGSAGGVRNGAGAGPGAVKTGDAMDDLREAPTLLAQHTKNLRLSALKDVLAAGLMAGGLGVGARALIGSRYLFGRPSGPEVERTVLPDELPLPTPVFRDQKARDKSLANAGYAGTKAADGEEPGGLAKALGFLTGSQALEKTEIPLYVPGLMAAGLGGAFGGYHLADHLIRKKRMGDLDAETEAAKERFRNALLGGYSPAQVPTAKLASGEPDLAAELDRLADLAGVSDEHTTVKAALARGEKAAAGERTLGEMLGMYGAFAVPLAGLTGLAAYQYTKARSPDTLLEEALKRRQRERLAVRPPEVTAVPEPVHVNRTGVLAPDDQAAMTRSLAL